MFDFNTNLKGLVWTMFTVFFILTLGIAVYPSFQMQNEYGPLPEQRDLTRTERQGLNIYIAEGCVACHTQQVRNIEMDATWGSRPAIPQDYYYSKQRQDLWRQSPSLLGSERTGPDLTEVGKRQSSEAWHLLHLYEPRAVVEGSVMPSYRWLFEEVDSSYVNDSDVVVKGIPEEFIKDPSKKIVATSKALALVDYLVSLKQPDLPEGMEAPEFIPLREKDKEMVGSSSEGGSGIDGRKLYENTCAVCHQSNGKGVSGAFPGLEGSGIVLNPEARDHIKIIIAGKDDNPNYGPMQPFGDELTDAEIAAIVNHERTSWGNDAPTVDEEDVRKVREELEE